MATYSPKDTILTFCGYPITGFGEGTFIVVERDEEAFKKVVGAGGEVSRTANCNFAGKVTITLGQTSPDNAILSSLQRQDEQFHTGVGPLLIKDLNGTTLVSAMSAWVQKPAKIEFAKEQKDREWTIDCGSMVDIVGGAYPDLVR